MNFPDRVKSTGFSLPNESVPDVGNDDDAANPMAGFPGMSEIGSEVAEDALSDVLGDGPASEALPGEMAPSPASDMVDVELPDTDLPSNDDLFGGAMESFPISACPPL